MVREEIYNDERFKEELKTFISECRNDPKVEEITGKLEEIYGNYHPLHFFFSSSNTAILLAKELMKERNRAIRMVNLAIIENAIKSLKNARDAIEE